MPDYTLKRNSLQVPKQPIPPQPQTQSAPPQTPSAISQLSAASQQSKLETENALLREALATSAQNCEALMKQLAESQKEFIKTMTTMMGQMQHQVRRAEETAYHQLKAMSGVIEDYGNGHSGMIDRYSQSHQSQLSKLESMNQAFNQSLNAVLAQTEDSLIAQVAADTQIALAANTDAMNAIIKAMETASAGVTVSVKDFNKNLNDTFKKSKTILDSRAKAYHTAMQNLFKVDGWRQAVFWLGIAGGILTPIVLIIGRFL